MKDEYPKEDTCRVCGVHIGWILHPLAEALALRLCEKQTCWEIAEKMEEPNHEV